MIFCIRRYDTQPDEQQPEGSRTQTEAAQQADLLHNNRQICCEFASERKQARRASERELSASSREAPQAWHFGLALVWRRRPNEKRRRQANSARRRPENYAICCDLPSLLARLSLFSLDLRSRCCPPVTRASAPGAQMQWRSRVGASYFILPPRRFKRTGARGPAKNHPQCPPNSPLDGSLA